MNILVTGGTGFVGTNLIKKLLKNKDNNIISYDSYYVGKIENEQIGCKYYHQDLANGYWYIREDIDVIYHLAAFARIQPSIKNPVETLKNNYLSTLNIIETASTSGIPIVYSGSSSFHHGIFKSPYAWSKHCGEQLCELYNKAYGLRTAIARFYNVYGPYQIEDGRWSTVLGIFEKQYRQKKPLTIVGTGEQRRDFTHIDDIVDGLIAIGDLIISQKKAPDNVPVFELGRGKNHSINEIAAMFGKDYPREYIPTRKGEYDITLADLSYAKTYLNYSPTKNIEDYIHKIVNS
tara:strand:+ start:3685 stop:4557 length:873 start_codon:yes stop_codon:yes gene_type:complete